MPDWIVALTALVTALYAAYQLKLLRIAREDGVESQRLVATQRMENLKIQQGLQLMEIDKQYEGVLQPSRKALLTLRRRLAEDISDGGDDARQQLSEKISAYLAALRVSTEEADEIVGRKTKEEAVNEYFLLTQLPNYIETMGVLVHEELVDEVALIRLYDGMVDRVIGDVLPHIYWRRQQDNNPHYLFFAERLYEKAAAHLRMPAAVS